MKSYLFTIQKIESPNEILDFELLPSGRLNILLPNNYSANISANMTFDRCVDYFNNYLHAKILEFISEQGE